MSSVLVGMFDNQAAAQDAKSKLVSAGFASAALTAGSMSNTATPATAESHESGVGHFFRSLFGGENDTVNAEHTATYSEAFKRGNHAVSVKVANDDEADKAEDILDDCGAVNVDEKAEEWKKDGWAGASAVNTVAGTMPGATQKLQELEEELKVGKRAVSRGGVRVFTRMTEIPVEETVRLREEHANVVRTAVDRPATEADFAAFKDGTIEVREMGEEAVVGKTARVTGEVSVGKNVTEHEEVIRDTVRKTTVDVEQLGTESVDPTTGLPTMKKPM